jgi:phosphinothricin acetyltransferase
MEGPLIRIARTSDAKALLEWYGPLITETAISFETEPLTLEALKRRMGDIQARYPWLVCELNGVPAGFSYAGPHRPRPGYLWSVETAIYVAAEHRRRGIARALYTSLLALLRLQGFQSAYAGITLPNESSVTLHESMGFTPVGVYRNAGFKLGRWHDAGWWQIQIRDILPDEPRPPLTPDEARVKPEWSSAISSGLSGLVQQTTPGR